MAAPPRVGGARQGRAGQGGAGRNKDEAVVVEVMVLFQSQAGRERRHRLVLSDC